MRKTILKKLTLAALIAAVSTAGGALPLTAAFASTGNGGEIAQPYYVAISNKYCTLSRNGNTVTCEGYTRVKGGYQAEVTIELQVNEDGWRNVETWSGKSAPAAQVLKTRAVTGGKSYRLKATHRAYNSSGSVVETLYSYSSIV